MLIKRLRMRKTGQKIGQNQRSDRLRPEAASLLEEALILR